MTEREPNFNLFKPGQSEEGDQILVMNWLLLNHPDYWKATIHVPNGGKRNAREAARLKQMGVKAGVSDILCFKGSGQFVGLALEMKDEGGGRESPKQKEWGQLLTSQHWAYCVEHGYHRSVQAFREYIALD